MPLTERVPSLSVEAVTPARSMDLRSLFEAHHGSIWRLLRRLGVPPAQLDDVTQEVFWVAARRLACIEPGREHSFLYGVALRVAAEESRRRRSAVPVADLDQLAALSDARPTPEQMLSDRQQRALLDDVLDRMHQDLRAVLVLHEIEGWELRQIAELEEIPVGTAASRLRRAREEFSAIAKRVRAGLLREEGGGHGD